MRIYLTRHGETEWNIAGKMQGWANSNLSSKGIQEAKNLGNRLKDCKFAAVYSSPLGRAYDTAKYIVDGRSNEIILLDNFKEMHFGCWEGTSHSEVKEKYPDVVNNLWNNPGKYEPIDGETISQFVERIKKGLDIIIENNPEGNVLLVTHALAIKAIYKIVNGSEINDIWQGPAIHNTSLTIINVENGQMTIELSADNSHNKGDNY